MKTTYRGLTNPSIAGMIFWVFSRSPTGKRGCINKSGHKARPAEGDCVVKKLMVILSVCLLAGMAIAETPSDYTELPEGYIPAEGHAADGDMAGQGRDLTFFDNFDEFAATYPEIAGNGECFEATNVPAGIITACEGPFNSATNNDCFSPGALMDGFSLHNDGISPDDLNVVLGVGSFGNESVWVGPNTFLSNATIQYDPPVDTIGIMFQFPLGAALTTVEVYGVGGGLLGVVDFPGDNDVFLGISSTDPISSIIVYAADGAGEIFDCIYFGNGVVANEASTWTSVKSVYR